MVWESHFLPTSENFCVDRLFHHRINKSKIWMANKFQIQQSWVSNLLSSDYIFLTSHGNLNSRINQETLFGFRSQRKLPGPIPLRLKKASSILDISTRGKGKNYNWRAWRHSGLRLVLPSPFLPQGRIPNYLRETGRWCPIPEPDWIHIWILETIKNLVVSNFSL